MSASGFHSYSFTHYITDTDVLYTRNGVKNHVESTNGDNWRLEFQHRPTISHSAVVLTLVGRTSGECCFYTKVSMLDGDRQSKLELVQKGWAFVESLERFFIPNEMLQSLIESEHHLLAISVDIMKIPKTSAAEELSKSLKSDSFGDFKVTSADGEIFNCHKDILSARSSMFAGMFKSGMKESLESEVSLKDFNSDVITALLRFCYLGDWGDLSNVADRLYVAADVYQLEQLKLVCAAELILNLNAESIGSTFLLAELHKDKLLMAACVDYLATHKREISLVDVMTANATSDESDSEIIIEHF